MNILIAFEVFFPMLGGAACYCLGRKSKSGRDALAIIVCALTLGAALAARGSLALEGVLGLGLRFAVTGLARVMSVLTGFVWLFSELFAREYLRHAHGRSRYHLFCLLTLGATEGVFLSDDLFTTFVFFEMMSFTSYAAVKQTQDKKALRAGQTYLAIAVSTGMAALTGLFLLYHEMGSLRFADLANAAPGAGGKAFAASVLMLIGFGAKAGMVPVHVWLPDTHPAAPAPFSAILSCVLTKTGVFGILTLSCTVMRLNMDWGGLVMALGLITMLLGAVLAVLSVDLKRTLACSSLSQIGFILTAIGARCLLGDEGVLAMDGTVAHIVNHALVKLGLFTAAGVVVMNRDQLNLNRIRGYGRHKPFLMACFLLPALSVSGIPLFGGYISKTLIHESLLECGVPAAFEWIFIVSGGLTLSYMTKLFVCLFVEKGAGEEPRGTKYLGFGASAALFVSAAAMPLFGMLPGWTLGRIGKMAQPFLGGAGVPNGVSCYSAENLLGACKSIGIGILVYALVVRLLLMRNGAYVDRKPEWLSLENGVYRPLVQKVLPGIGLFLGKALHALPEGTLLLLKKVIFNRDDSAVTPRQSRTFARYSDEPFLRKGFSDTLAFSFLLLGVCVTAGLLYILMGRV